MNIFMFLLSENWKTWGKDNLMANRPLEAENGICSKEIYSLISPGAIGFHSKIEKL